MRPALAAACLALVTAAHAEPATPEGAKKIADAYAAYLSPAAVEKGFVTVKPEGDDYIVAFDLEKALAAMDAPPGVVKTSAFSYRLTPTVNGGWLAKSNALPGLTITPGGGEGGTVAFEGFRFDGLYDPAAPDFFLGKIAMPSLRMDFKAKSGGDFQHIVVTQDGTAADIRIRAGAEGGSVDFRSAQSAAGSSQKTAAIAEGGAETPVSEVRQRAATGDGGAAGLRAGAFGDLWRYLVAHAQEPKLAPEAMKPLLTALLPLWRELSGEIEVNDVAVAFPGGSVSFKSVSEDLRLTGVAEKASASLGLAFQDVSAEVAAAPDWARGVWPASLALRLEGGVDGLDKAARMALDDPEFLASGNLGEETQTRIAQLLVAGRPHLKLSATRLKTPLVEATVEGEAAFDGEPSAHGRITADSLDKLLETLAKIAETQPEAQQALFVVTFLRGLARNEDGKLIWDIEYSGPSAVKVNGQLFPPAGTEQPEDEKEKD